MIKRNPRRLRVRGVLSVVLLMGMAALNLAHADISVPVGGSMALGGGSTDLGCGDVRVAGTLLLQNGSLSNVRNLTIASGGSVVAGNGVITLSGNWSNSGSFNAGTGVVNFVDAPTCSAGSTISGSTTFATFSLVSTSGKLYQFATGSTQNIRTMFVASGTAVLPLRIESTAPLQTAFINLTGQQTMNDLAVTYVRAIGVPHAPLLSNRNTTGVAIGWFGLTEASFAVPTASAFMLGVICLSLLLFGIGALRRTARFPLNRKD